ncbi:filament-like plant protein 4 [Silene latifolia]|uniref:filament-like plant protein 4 n=1 Tax=Silene latifolia TaxID=37657 RepID=UPI003D783EEC
MERRSWPWKKKSSEKSAAEKAIATLDSAGGFLPSAGSQTQTDKNNYKKPEYIQISLESYTNLTGAANQVKKYEKKVETYEDQAKSYEDQVQALQEEINELNETLSSANSEITSKEQLVKQHAKVAEEAVSGWEKAEAEALTLKTHLESVTLAKLAVEDRAAHLDGAVKECMKQIRNLKEENERKLEEVTFTKNKQYDRMKHELETKIACLDQDLMSAEAESAAISRSLHERSNMLIKVSEEKSQAEAQIELLKSNVECCEREINSLKYELNIVSKEMEIRNEEKNMSVKTAEVANKQLLESVKKTAKLEAECQRLRGLVKKKLPGPAALAQMKLEVDNLGRNHPMTPSSPQFSSNAHLLGVPELSLDNVQKFQKENEFLTKRLVAMEEETKMLKEALAKRNSELQSARSICAMTTSKLQNLEKEKSFSRHASSRPCTTSVSEDGNDDTVSCAESWASALISELPHIKEKSKEKSMKSENGSHLELMDDFEEMEKLARNGNLTANTELDSESSPLAKLQAKVSRVFKSVSNESNMLKILEDINQVVQEERDNLHPHTISCAVEEKHCSVDRLNEKGEKISRELAAAITQIHSFISSRGRVDEMSHEVEQFSAAFNRILCNEISLEDLIIALSLVLAKASELTFGFKGYVVNEAEVGSPACVDKVALPENKPPQGDRFSNGFGHISDSCSNPKVPQEVNISGFEPGSCQCSSGEIEQLKAEKDSMERVIFRCSQELEKAKSQLSDVKLELANSQKTNSLADIQLKCMAESYKTLEKRAEELDGEVNTLLGKIESLNNELETERTNREDALARCRDLEEQLQRNDECSVCSSSAAEVDNKAKQDKDLEAAAEKLAACQETIFLLGKQLKFMSSPNSERSISESEDAVATISGLKQQDMDTATCPFLQRAGSDSPLNLHNAPMSPSNNVGNMTRSPVSSKYTIHRPTKSGSSTPTSDKYSRGFSRFFSSKEKYSN